ncbi:hypothetical protein PVAP13_9KG454600 [Panicum virgatum]|uniref:Uncharacterized protein n=1 Tax=Panicum virgatum TaxID=38727 RepID=A0A8T0NX68_PANVG|nr:hypothetical protein PVAP13_9KG454600 [Panicum virgatum]
MAASEAASPPFSVEMMMGAAGLTGFEPCAWGDFFITHAPPLSQEAEKRMRERVEQLKGELRRRVFGAAGEAMSVADTVALVDTLERLGVDAHFREEIGAALRRVVVVNGESCSDNSGSGSCPDSDLRVVALRFRLLRQHGYWVPTDVFDRFRDATGSFRASLSSDPGSLLSLYNAAHMAIPGERVLYEAISFCRRHLESMRGELASPMAEQVSRALDIPLPRLPKRLETVRYIAEYAREGHDPVALELARLDFDLVRALHLEELRALSLWWKEVYGDVKLSYARDRLVENYFWTCGVFHEEEYSRARILFAKTFGMLSLMDDTYDVYATLEDCHILNEAIQRWDESAVSTLPQYMRRFYINLLKTFQESEDSLQPHEKYRVSYAKKALSSKYYLDEAKWCSEKYAPSFEEHVEVSVMSSGFPTLAVVLLMGAGDLATREAFEWAIGEPAVVSASGEVARFLNDIASYRKGKNKKDALSSVECYARERGVSGEEAAAAIAGMAEHAWRTINRSCMEVGGALLPAARLVVNLTKTLEVIYLGGRDAYTFAGDLRDLVVSLFLNGPAA